LVLPIDSVTNVIDKRTLNTTEPYTFSRDFHVLKKHALYVNMNANLALSKETLITLAIKAYNKGQKKTLRAVALAFGAPLDLTYKRYHGRTPRAK
jgi:hypothetical protein